MTNPGRIVPNEPVDIATGDGQARASVHIVFTSTSEAQGTIETSDSSEVGCPLSDNKIWRAIKVAAVPDYRAAKPTAQSGP